MIQRFIISRPIKSTIMRLVFHTKNSGTQKANYAYRIQNRLDIYDTAKKSLTNKAAINMEQEDNIQRWNAKKDDEFSFEYQLVKGPGLRDYEFQAEYFYPPLLAQFPSRGGDAIATSRED